MLRWLPMGSSAQHKVDPSLSSSNAFWMIIPQKRNFMEANSIVGVCCFAAAVHNTSIRHNEAFLHIYDCGDLRFLCFHTSCCPLMTSQETRAHSSNCSVVGRKSAKFCNFENSWKINENSYKDNFFAGVIRKTREFIYVQKKIGG